jgi:hypothetical protein
VTELGPVPVHWRRGSAETPLEFEVQIPLETRATLWLNFVGTDPEVVLNDRALSSSQVRTEGRYAVIEIGPGRHRGRLTVHPPQH